MKIRIITPSRSHATEWSAAVERLDPGFQVTPVVQALQQVNVLVNGSRPDLVVVETDTRADFEALERLAGEHPELEYVLVGAGLSSEMLMRAMRVGVREVLPPECSAADIGAAVTRLARKRPAAGKVEPRRGELIGLLSSKGGSGATFVAANLAQMLAAGGEHRVALIDLNLQFGDAALLLGTERAGSDVAEVARNIQRLDAELLQAAMSEVSPGLWVLAAPEDPGQASDVGPQHVEAILQLARTMYDYVVVDVGRSVTGVTIKALDLCDRLYPVLQLSLPFVRDARRLQDLFSSLDYPAAKIHWIVNRCDKHSPITLDDLRKSLGVSELITLPNHYGIASAAVNQGVPVERLAPSSALARSLREFAERIAPAAPKARGSWLSGLLRAAVPQPGGRTKTA